MYNTCKLYSKVEFQSLTLKLKQRKYSDGKIGLHDASWLYYTISASFHCVKEDMCLFHSIGPACSECFQNTTKHEQEISLHIVLTGKKKGNCEF